MENIQWPPAGSMGPIFGEYLYIRFFQRTDVEEGKPYWNEAKMQELLMQIRYSVVPDPQMIEEGIGKQASRYTMITLNISYPWHTKHYRYT